MEDFGIILIRLYPRSIRSVKLNFGAFFWEPLLKIFGGPGQFFNSPFIFQICFGFHIYILTQEGAKTFTRIISQLLAELFKNLRVCQL